MSTSAESPPAAPASAAAIDVPARPAESIAWGMTCGLLAAIGYTAANVCLRSVVECDAIWVSCVKSLPTVLIVGPCLVWLAARGRRVLPPLRVLGLLAAAGLLGQLGGNISFQWALGVIGIALTVPLTLVTMIVAGALCGRLVLHEPITPRAAASIVVLVAAIAVLSAAAPQAQSALAETTGRPPTAGLLALGVAATCLAGLAYAILGVVIRYGVSGQAPVSTVLFTIGLVGLLSLGALSFERIGWEGMRQTTSGQLAWMLAAGVWNAAAFWALTKSLQLLSIIYVNALNATQAAMAAAAGVLFFAEPISATLVIGVALTAAGLVLMRNHEQHAARRASA